MTRRSLPHDPGGGPCDGDSSQHAGALTPAERGAACRSEILARLTLSALERGAGDPGLWREPAVHRAVLVSGLSLLVAAMRRLSLDVPAEGA